MISPKLLPKLDLNITNRCNFKCIHCAFNSGEKQIKEFSKEKIKEILIDAKKLGGKKIDITGGEATLRKDLFQIIRLAKSLDYKIELVTNGSLLNKKILKKLKSIKLDSLAISLDGADYKTFSAIRPIKKSIYKKIINNIKLAKLLGFIVKINSAVFDSNLNELSKITEFCIKNSLDEHGLYYFTPIGRGINKNNSVEPIKWLNFIRKYLSKFKGKIKLTLETPIIEKNKFKEKLGCIANCEKSHLQILPDGNVYPCAILASYNKPVANLYKTTIPKIWQNKKHWNKYWKESLNFKNNYCVNFVNFDINNFQDYKNKYQHVCPLRKFRLEEVL